MGAHTAQDRCVPGFIHELRPFHMQPPVIGRTGDERFRSRRRTALRRSVCPCVYGRDRQKKQKAQKSEKAKQPAEPTKAATPVEPTKPAAKPEPVTQPEAPVQSEPEKAMSNEPQGKRGRRPRINHNAEAAQVEPKAEALGKAEPENKAKEKLSQEMTYEIENNDIQKEYTIQL